MKFIRIIILLLIVGCSDSSHPEMADSLTIKYINQLNNGYHKKDTLKGSPRLMATGIVGDLEVKVNYSSPGVKGRTIWGGLVAYDQVWVTGAHRATSISFSKPIKIENTKVPAGDYAFFTIPGRNNWTLIVNKNHNQHLADDYDKTLDIVRVSVSPDSLNQMAHRLYYKVDNTSSSTGEIIAHWEYLKVSLPFEVVE